MVLSYSNVPVQTMQTIISRRIARRLVLVETVYFVMQTNTDPRKIARHLFCVCFGLGAFKNNINMINKIINIFISANNVKPGLTPPLAISVQVLYWSPCSACFLRQSIYITGRGSLITFRCEGPKIDTGFRQIRLWKRFFLFRSFYFSRRAKCQLLVKYKALNTGKLTYPT